MFIYKIECVKNGKCYIGQTKNFKKRVQDHLLKLNKNNHYSNLLQLDFNNYGIESFVFEILEEVSELESDEKERIWIKELTSVYNTESGGVKNKKLAQKTKLLLSEKGKIRYQTHYKYINSKEAIVKRSKTNTGKKRTDEFREKMSVLASNRVGEKNSFFGKTHTEETKRKISEANKGKYDGGKPKIKIKAINLETGVEKVYESKADASRDGFPSREYINQCIKGLKKSYKKHTFKELQ